MLIFGRAYTWRGFSECHGISPKKLYSDFSYNLAFFHKNIKNRIVHPCQDMFDFYEQALLTLNLFVPNASHISSQWFNQDRCIFD